MYLTAAEASEATIETMATSKAWLKMIVIKCTTFGLFLPMHTIRPNLITVVLNIKLVATSYYLAKSKQTVGVS